MNIHELLYKYTVYNYCIKYEYYYQYIVGRSVFLLLYEYLFPHIINYVQYTPYMVIIAVYLLLALISSVYLRLSPFISCIVRICHVK